MTSADVWPIDPLFAAVALVLLLAVFAGALLHKLRDTAAFAQALDGYQLLPAWALRPATFVLALVELAAVALAVWPASRQLGATVLLVLLLLYTAAIAINLIRGRTSFDCGCGWGGASDGVSRISAWLIYRNLFVMLAAMIVLAPAGVRALHVLDSAVVVMGGVSAVVIYVFADRLIHNWHHLTASRARS